MDPRHQARPPTDAAKKARRRQANARRHYRKHPRELKHSTKQPKPSRLRPSSSRNSQFADLRRHPSSFFCRWTQSFNPSLIVESFNLSNRFQLSAIMPFLQQTGKTIALHDFTSFLTHPNSKIKIFAVSTSTNAPLNLATFYK